MPPLAVRYRLAAVQRGGVTELRAVAHRRVDIEHGFLADENVPSEGDRSGLDSPRVCPVTEEERLPADHRPGADGEQIGAHRHTPGEDRDARPDFRAQRPEIKRVEGRANEQKGARVRPDQGLDDPEADVDQTPDADLLGLPTTDEHPLRQDRKGTHREETGDATQNQPHVDIDTI